MDHAEYYRVSHDIALGMNYLHQHKPQVLRLDLKSTNFLLDSSGRAKIADFGFSKFRFVYYVLLIVKYLCTFTEVFFPSGEQQVPVYKV
jgi:serine/threonine protein kinase